MAKCDLFRGELRCYQGSSVDVQNTLSFNYLNLGGRSVGRHRFFIFLGGWRRDDYTRLGSSFFCSENRRRFAKEMFFAQMATKQSGSGKTPNCQNETKIAVIHILPCQCIHREMAGLSVMSSRFFPPSSVWLTFQPPASLAEVAFAVGRNGGGFFS